MDILSLRRIVLDRFCYLLLLINLPGLALAQYPLIEWTTALHPYHVDKDEFIGQRLLVVCPKRTQAAVLPAIHGTNSHPSDSAICVAALHAGVITEAGGPVTLQLNPGADAYVGSERNGVLTTDFGATERSIAIVNGPSLVLDKIRRDFAPRINWDTKFTRTGLANRNLVGQYFTFHCSAASGNPVPRRVYGTDRYAFSSLICLSAVHAGQLTFAGGFVTLRMHADMEKLEGSIRHGIESRGGGGGARSLSFVSVQDVENGRE